MLWTTSKAGTMARGKGSGDFACVRKPMRHSGRAFTLIELLVVVAIIAILAAMLMPALESAREAARVTTCVGQQRQVLLSAHIYMDDYDGNVPTPTPDRHDPSSHVLNNNNWVYAGLLWQGGYLGTTAVLWCPSMKMKLRKEKFWTRNRDFCLTGEVANDTHWGSYAWAYQTKSDGEPYYYSPGLHRLDWAKNSKTGFFLGEYHYTRLKYDYHTYLHGGWMGYGEDFKANMGYMDGSVSTTSNDPHVMNWRLHNDFWRYWRNNRP